MLYSCEERIEATDVLLKYADKWDTSSPTQTRVYDKGRRDLDNLKSRVLST